MLTYDFRLPPGPRTVEYAVLAEDLIGKPAPNFALFREP